MNDKKLNRQIDLQVSGLHVRETEGEKSRTIEGHAVVFGVRSVNLTPWSDYREVYEIMEPGSIDRDLLNRSDVVLTAFHDNTAILGRWRQGKGTLDLSLDERGLHIACTLADTERANELLSAIERGDIDGMSFAFRANEDDSENGVSYEKLEQRSASGKEVWLRHVKRVTELYDVTIAGHPAYPQTDVAQREALDTYLNERIGEPADLVAKREADAKAEAEAKERKEQEERERAEREAKEEADRLEREQKRRLAVMRQMCEETTDFIY